MKTKSVRGESHIEHVHVRVYGQVPAMPFRIIRITNAMVATKKNRLSRYMVWDFNKGDWVDTNPHSKNVSVPEGTCLLLTPELLTMLKDALVNDSAK